MGRLLKAASFANIGKAMLGEVGERRRYLILQVCGETFNILTLILRVLGHVELCSRKFTI